MSTIGVFYPINTGSLLALYILSLAQGKKENLEEATRLCSEALMIEKLHRGADHPNLAKSENCISN